MLSYLQKYNDLQNDLKSKVSSSEVMKAISEIEKKYEITLATVIMRVMVREISILDLQKFFVFEYDMDGKKAEDLVEELKQNVFKEVADYLGFSFKEAIDSETLNIMSTEKQVEPEIRGSSFFFSPEDEEEVKALAQKLEGFKVEKKQVTEKIDENIIHKTDEIVRTVNIHFSSGELKERFKKIVSTYLKGVRNRIDTKHTLMKPVEDGGLGLDEILSNKAIRIIEKINKESNDSFQKPEKKIEEPKLKIEKEKNNVPERDVPYDFKALKSESKQDIKSTDKPEVREIQESSGKDKKAPVDLSSVSVLSTPEISKEEVVTKKEEAKDKAKGPEGEAALKPNEEKKEENKSERKQAMDLHTLNLKLNPTEHASMTSGEKKKDKKEAVLNLSDMQNKNIKEKKTAEVPTAQVVIKRTKPSMEGKDKKNGKVRMHDVKHVPKLTGPVDELGEMNIVNFRRLSANPKEAVKKIIEKINFLEEDSYAKRLEAIKAWRQSPLNKLYLKIGQNSIEEKKRINEILEELRNKQEEFLSVDEFNSVMELNKSIRY